MREPVPLLYWDVDTQQDFLAPEGKLFVPESHLLLENLASLTRAARERSIPVVASADHHRMSDDEISEEPDFATTYPPHCMQGTAGAAKVPETHLEGAVEIGWEPKSRQELTEALGDPPRVVLLKRTTDVFSNPNAETVLDLLRPQRIVVYGVALDVCNRHAVEGLWKRGHRNLQVVTDATQALDADTGKVLLEDWRKRGIHLVTTTEVLA